MSESQESFTPQEAALLQPFVTNLDRPIFGLRNLPEVVKGALFSRYSRSDKSLRRILLDEFITAPEAGFDRIVGGAAANNVDQLVAIQQAEAFYDRVLVGYGDDSVAELGGAHLACEGISNIAAKALEDSRLGLSPLEKSTRYVPFNRKVEGRYRYYREPSILASSHRERYETALDSLFETYTTLIDPLSAWVQSCTPRDAATSERAYASATRAKTLDLLRGLLPMATLTNVGLFGNGRAFEYLLVKLAASPHPEVRSLGMAMQQELDCLIPSFVKRAKTERGAEYARYIANNQHQTQILAQQHLGLVEPTSLTMVQLVEFDPEAEGKVIAAILYPQTDLPFEQVREYAAGLSATDRLEILQAYVGDRASRFHRPGRAFEETYYTFDMLADLGAYRDLHRHRVLTQERQRYTVRHGYIVPEELKAAGLAAPYRTALESAADAIETIAQDLPEASQYAVPFAYRIRWRMRLNLREAYHLIELRSARQGHPTYRAIAQEMYRQIEAVHPVLVAPMQFVDLNDYVLERLAAEQRLDVKLAQRSQP
ncbi:MAG: FAD-dependent thymidylate synthase [Leptolyngbyaceae cyanobacterium bins.59]|nr:FAD-dependent thymidylate synthase [Leptolyngbyaceae cyanobacterium bins.59]